MRWGAVKEVSEAPVPWVDTLAINSVHVGYVSACGLRLDGRVQCWGNNERGQLGTGDLLDRDQPTLVSELVDVKQLSVGTWAACAVRADATLWCWGDNDYGQLGDGTVTDRASPVQLQLQDVEEVSILAAHACARTALGEVWCWGSNSFEQVADGSLGDVITTPRRVEGIEGARSIAVGSFTSCALLGDRDVWCWGDNSQGAFGNGTWEGGPTPRRVVWDSATP